MIQAIPTVAPRRLTPMWVWVLLVLFALSVLIVLTGFNWMSQFHGAPVHLVIDGDDYGGFELGVLSGWDIAGLACAAVVAVFAVLVIVPVVLLFSLAIALIGIVLGVAVPLLAVVVVTALVLSPLWLLAALVWWLVRRPLPAMPHAA
jgi:hypothetical protein